jgi:hypothetical protein
VNADDLFFTVSLSMRATESLRAIGRSAQAGGRILDVRDAARKIYSWLRADPETLGEPFKDHPALELTEYCAFEGPLIVRYVVHRPTKQVFIALPFRVARWAGF